MHWPSRQKQGFQRSAWRAKLFSESEIGLFYADVIVSGVVLLVGVLRFMWDVIRERD